MFGFGKKDDDATKDKAPKIRRRQRTVAEDDKYGFKALRQGEERARIRRGSGW